MPSFGDAGAAAGATVHPAAKLGTGVTVEPGAVIGAGAEIGANTVIGANAVINVRYSTASITSGAAEILAYGTAVVLE